MKRSKPERYAAVDIGAESGRIVVAETTGDRLSVEVVHRFANVPVRLDDGLHWDLEALFEEAVAGLRRAGPLAGVGVDAWGCDYALIAGDGRMIRTPFHHRDPRTALMPAKAFARVSREELYDRTGIQHLRFNTVFQLLADAEAGVDLGRAERIALIPDLLNRQLSGTLVNEATVASTTGLVDARTRSWAADLAEELGLPAQPFRHALVEPGVPLGEITDLEGAPLLRTVAAHDTASAFAATPLAFVNAAVISCGTWSLVGVELDHPQLGADAAAANLSNEWGIDGTTRLLRNVAGLWLLQECRREWERRGLGVDYEELQLLAASSPDDVPLFDPDLDLFLEPGEMTGRIAAACGDTGQPAPASQAECTRSILLSLACKYRLVLEVVARVSGRSVDVVHLVGGGARNDVLCQLAADVLGVPVVAGPAEATAIGSLLVQARAAGAFDSREEMRNCVSRSFPPRLYEPAGESDVYDRFLALTGAGDRVPA